MPSHRMGRTTEDIRRELSAILREVKDPRVQGNGMISIVRVEVTNDLSYCTVYISSMTGMEHAQNAVKGLKSAAGFIRAMPHLYAPASCIRSLLLPAFLANSKTFGGNCACKFGCI